MSKSEFVFVYSTFPDRDVAEDMAAVLVREKLAACVNIHATMTSVYIWDDTLETEAEVAVIIKTRASLADQAIEAARKMHPYSVPCFLVLPIADGNADYLDWMRQQTRAK